MVDQQNTGTLPYSIESESAVIGALLMNNDAWDSVADILVGDSFFRQQHRLIFEAIAKLINANKPADVITVFGALQSSGDAERVGGFEYLNELAQFVHSTASVRRYAEIVSDRAMIRKLLAAAAKAQDIATEAGLTAAERLDQCQHEFQQLAQVRGKKESRPIIEYAMAMMDKVDAIEAGRAEPAVRTRIPTLDSLLCGGLRPGKQVVIAARPSVGKSALAMELAYAFVEQGLTAGFLSQEMEGVELAERLAARMGMINLGSIVTGKMSQDEWSSLSDVVERMNTMGLYIDDESGLTLGEIQAKSRKLKREANIGMLVLDYLQLCAPSNKQASRHHQIEEISRGLKVMAKHLGLTTVILSQLNRISEGRNGGRPMLADLKESGSIEEDADVVILLSVDGTRENGDVVVHAEVAKNRGGSKGFVKLAFSGKNQRFVETIADMTDTRQKPKRNYSEDV